MCTAPSGLLPCPAHALRLLPWAVCRLKDFSLFFNFFLFGSPHDDGAVSDPWPTRGSLAPGLAPWRVGCCCSSWRPRARGEGTRACHPHCRGHGGRGRAGRVVMAVFVVVVVYFIKSFPLLLRTDTVLSQPRACARVSCVSGPGAPGGPPHGPARSRVCRERLRVWVASPFFSSR